MKLTTLFLTAAFLNVSARGVSQNITLHAENAPLKTVFRAIEKQTKCIFFYQAALLKSGRNVTMNVSNLPLQAALDSCFANQPFTWSMEGRIITLESRPSPVAALVAAEDTVARPGLPLVGTIMDEASQPLSGATVVIKGTGRGTNTDSRGRFELKSVPPGTVLVISFIGYNKVEHKVSSDKYLTLRMTPATNTLDEKVVKAYGSTSQRYTTGDISTVSAAEIERQPVMNPLLALQGLVPGMVITTNSNAYPSATVKVEIRGRNSLNASIPSDPLYVIDGVPLTILQVSTSTGGTSSYANGSTGFIQNNNVTGPTYGGAGMTGQSPLFNINPLDIESISILKDADATALYGARAANGVILITTKHGKAGPTSFSINARSGTSFITRYWDMLNTPQYLHMRNEAFANGGTPPTVSSAPDLLVFDTTRYTNWQKFLWGHLGQVTNAHLSLSGGDQHTTFLMGAGFSSQSDITRVSGLNDLFSTNLSVNHSSLDRKLNIALQATYSISNVNEIQVQGAATLPPDAPAVYDAKGNLNYAGWGTYSYPFAPLKQPYNDKTTFLNSSVSASYSIIKGLTARLTLGYNTGSANQLSVTPIASQNPGTNPKATINQGRNDNNNVLIDPRIDYNTLIGKGKLTVIAGGSLQKTITEGLGVTGNGIASDAQLGSISNATTFTSTDNWGEQKVASVFGNIGYNWDGKYVLSLNGRRDGSTNFAPDNRFGSFGSAGVAWLLSEESWMKYLLPSAISLIKLRGNYGTTGGSGATPFSYLSQWSSNSYTNSPYGGLQTAFPQIHADPDYHWETDKKLDVGLTLGFIQDRIVLNASYYRNRCDNQLTALPTPIFTGFASVTGNSPANVQNSGLEVDIHANIIDTRKFNWQAAFNIGINRNKLLSFPNFTQSSYTHTYAIGKPLNIIPLYKYTGVDPQTGRYTFVDHDQNGVIEANYSVPLGTDDMYILMLTDPKFTGGMYQSFRYAGVTLSANFYFKKQVGRNAQYGSTTGSMANVSTYAYDHSWQKPGDHALFSKISTTYDSYNGYFNNSTGIYTDASFIRLSNLTLSYALPAPLLKKVGMKGLTFNINTNNLFTLTKYKGLDPDIQSFGNMPPNRIITAGLNCSF